MIKVRPGQVFDFDAEEQVAEGGQRTVDPPPAPTIDDRANLYLNAVYGAREFKGEEYARARRIILDAMTIDVGAARKDIVEGGPGRENSVPAEHHHAALPDFPPAFCDTVLESEPAAEAAPLSRGQRRILPRHNARGRSFVLFSAIAGSLVFVAIAAVTLSLVLPNMRTESAGTTIALSPAEIKTLLSSGNSLKVVETSATRRVVSSELGERLFGLGNKLVAGGDMYGGRLILQEAANEGMASAAFALGATFDPIEAKALGRPDSSPDLEKAWAWYIKAKLLGSTEAQARLDRLEKYHP
jgi:hypothetical protein